jgi:two-component system, OmpR family, phosphate regulon sensor histidine kinase PhoR
MAESGVQAQPELIEALLAALPEAVFVVTPDLRVLAINGAATSILPALRKGDALLRGLRAPDVLDAIAAVFRTGEPQNALWLDRVPVERQFEIHVRPLAYDGVGACVVTLHDITEARRLDQMRADFVANASHELRTPLASLLGFIETLEGPAKDDAKAREKFLAIMHEQARRMSRLVSDLLSLSRIEQNLHMRPSGVVDLVSVTGQMVDSLRAMAAENGVEIRFVAGEPVFVQGERDELLRVAENLVENAIKYGAPAPVEVTVEARDGMGRLSVKDRGPGVAPEHLPRLTERFYRVDAGQSRAKGGTGLGLAIVKHIVARHRGRLSIESIVGQGSTFAVALPLASAGAQ